jgi:hypothetical protein
MPKVALVLLLCAPFAARADLYRSIDPETGSVKFSSSPPAAGNAEILPYRGPGVPVPDTQALEERRRMLRQSLLLAPADSGGAGDTLRQRAEAYRAVAAELDRLDPAGAERRRAEDAGLLEKLQPRRADEAPRRTEDKR